MGSEESTGGGDGDVLPRRQDGTNTQRWMGDDGRPLPHRVLRDVDGGDGDDVCRAWTTGLHVAGEAYDANPSSLAFQT